MLVGNHFFKHDESGDVVRVTTDDIPEGEFNKYNLHYADGKLIGDIVTRFAPSSPECHVRLNGDIIYEFEYPEFYTYIEKCKQKSLDGDADYDYFNKTKEEYDEFIAEQEGSDKPLYCPYFVILENRSVIMYQVIYADRIGFTTQKPEGKVSPEKGFIYNAELDVISVDCKDWIYTSESINVTTNAILLPLMPNNLNGDDKSYYFIVVRSRVSHEEDMVSFRSLAPGEINLYEPGTREPEIKENINSTQRNQIWDFYIPNGRSASVTLGEVTQGEYVEITNTGTESDAIFNFTLPKGEKGDAGGVLFLSYLQTSQPNQPKLNEKWYSESENNIKIYNGTRWIDFSEPDSGMIYLFEKTVYYYDGTKLLSTYVAPSINEDTLKINEDNLLDAIGLRTPKNDAYGIWVGNNSEYDYLKSNSQVENNRIYFIFEEE